MDIGIDWGAFPPLADAGALETAADGLREHARSFAQILWDNRDTWKGLGAHFESPDAGTLLAVLNPNEPRADDVFTDTNKAADALDDFAATERALAQEKNTLHGQYQSLLNEIGGNAEWVKDEGLVQRQQGIVDSMNDIISRHQSAEMTCANAINALYGGTRYVQVSADGSVPEGAQAYGMSREMLNSASGAGETPWAKPAEWDKPWFRDVVDGVVDFGSGVWESLRGTVTGLVALVNPFDWETFSATWKGIGTLATDIAITATPVGAFVSDERRAQSGERLVQVGEALLNVEMWKENPAKAAGMLTGDLATALIPGAGVAAKGVSTAAKAGRTTSVVIKAGQLSQKLGVPAVRAEKFTVSTIRGINSTTTKVQDLAYKAGRLKYDVTLKAIDKMPQPVAAALTRARVTAASFQSMPTNGGARDLPLSMQGQLALSQGKSVHVLSDEGVRVLAPGEQVARGEALHVEHRDAAMARVTDREMAMAGGGSKASGGAGAGSGGSGPEEPFSGGVGRDAPEPPRAASPTDPGFQGPLGVRNAEALWPDDTNRIRPAKRTFDPFYANAGVERGSGVLRPDGVRELGAGVYEWDDPLAGTLREVELNVAAKHSVAYHEDVLRKYGYVDGHVDTGANRAAHFTTPADREITRSFVMDHPAGIAERLDMPNSARQKIYDRQARLEATLSRSGLTEESKALIRESEMPVIYRDVLRKYDMDHKVDLQLGGLDAVENLNWLRQDVNRSWGSQLAWRSKILGVADGENPDLQFLDFSTVTLGKIG
ncbi:hypothetical protein [Micrococcus sp.]|uniref:hypothetical protein n=1 Tax=Micrococcus sp. TaxID=1271 RepID=UPI0026DD9DEA|nr:hypothetical protein [Micrococcus sp.]MDO4239237.1 hypothetical protein [Micrococcus sp.]